VLGVVVVFSGVTGGRAGVFASDSSDLKIAPCACSNSLNTSNGDGNPKNSPGAIISFFPALLSPADPVLVVLLWKLLTPPFFPSSSSSLSRNLWTSLIIESDPERWGLGDGCSGSARSSSMIQPDVEGGERELGRPIRECRRAENCRSLMRRTVSKKGSRFGGAVSLESEGPPDEGEVGVDMLRYSGNLDCCVENSLLLLEG